MVAHDHRVLEGVPARRSWWLLWLSRENLNDGHSLGQQSLAHAIDHLE